RGELCAARPPARLIVVLRARQGGAATWNTPLELWSGATVVDIVAVGTTTLVAGLRRCIPFDQCEVRIVRSTNSGASWNVIRTLYVSNWDPGPFFASYGTS